MSDHLPSSFLFVTKNSEYLNWKKVPVFFWILAIIKIVTLAISVLSYLQKSLISSLKINVTIDYHKKSELNLHESHRKKFNESAFRLHSFCQQFQVGLFGFACKQNPFEYNRKFYLCSVHPHPHPHTVIPVNLQFHIFVISANL